MCKESKLLPQGHLRLKSDEKTTEFVEVVLNPLGHVASLGNAMEV